ncbi:class I poly(R)-hydroxyalkanoic acid synthase [uncultured Aureimonas sp.]|uniref:class I poly(R)-hydroxyalkanoic acid synthase n=1 Tax=uncultured Aureimonas sp. TaxID=1604662 RepID=UPI0025D138A1|nr:class I poly(R)-hydroxyalkanoic acid synthase [uncultured Aureimonas sp.]
MAESTSTTDTPAGEMPSFSDYAVRDPEAFARNMARMLEQVGKAASAWVEPRERGEIKDGPLSYSDMVATLSRVGEYWLTDPARSLEAQSALMMRFMGLWADSIRKASGAPPAAEAPTGRPDKRFTHEDWSRNLFFGFLKEAYVITSDWANMLVERSDGLDPHTRQKAAFYVKQIANAISPSNFVLTNPELYRETVEQNGENLVRGMRMFAEDMMTGKGQLKLRQSDPTKFAVGKNLAMTPGKVVAENEVCQILQYTPQTETVFKRPILISPPWINRFYILDLNPEKSFIRWMVEQGHTVFVISWVNPTETHADRSWKDYIDEGIAFGLDTVEQATGEREVNMVGYCVGGTLLAASLPYLKARGDDRIASVTFLTTQIDFKHSGDLKVFVDEGQLAEIERTMEKGYLDGSQMATAFNLLRSGDLIWPYFVNNYLKGKEPLPFDLLFWNADATRMAKANHLFYLRNCYLENRLSRGMMEIGGVTLDLSTITLPVYNLATKEDHIAPALSVYEGSQALGAPVTYVVSGSGHIAGVVNPPAKNKYQFWGGPSPSRDLSFDDWWRQARETKGSWWPHWQAWLEAQSSERVPAREPGANGLPVIEDAPGRYVRQ